MSKNVAVFVDVANLYYAARGQDVDVDYVALLKHATKGRDLIRAYAYSGLDPENENQKKFLDFLGKNGYRVVAKDIRKFGDGRVKANLDIELVVDLFRLADRMDVAVIVSGDGDFAPAIRALQDEGVRCEVISFKPNTSSDLFAVADEFVDVMKISAISRQKDAKGVPAPEMPAKEVNPDVGFREASPSVAAAAMAAIRGDGEDAGSAGRGRGRAIGSRRSERPSRPTRGGRSRATDTDPIAITEPPLATDGGAPAARGAADDTLSESARRRRRRGGRGRGRRGRRGDLPDASSASAAADAEPAEIGWQEVDSIEELEGLGAGEGLGAEREFEFEEADAATLAELGLSSQPAGVSGTDGTDVPTQPAEAEATTSPAVTRKPRTRKPSTRAAAKPAAEPMAKAAAKPRARSTSKAVSQEPGGTRGRASASSAAAKPRASRTTRSKASPEPTEPSDEGIWKRFTSGRTTRKRAAPEPPTEG
ncbi:MAG TPA: NYN domain-containing protein [Thermoleophilaceae bacterium]|nr:NYN domain-containing protein [Thermoleophilaceae bacterium]